MGKKGGNNLQLDSELAEELIIKGFEAPDLDYKLEFDNSTQAWMELAKDVFGMANYGGGYIVIGVKDGTFEPIGLDINFAKDVQEWVEKFSKWSTGKIHLSYVEHVKEIKGEKRKFPIICVHGSIGSFVIPKIDGKYRLRSGETKIAFRQGILYVRRVTSTVAASGKEYWEFFWSLISRTATMHGSTEIPLEIISALKQKARADKIEETLWLNLFPVIEIPDEIYVAQTDFRKSSDIFEFLRKKMPFTDKNPKIPPFLLEDKKIYTFSPITGKNPLFLCVKEERTTLFDTQEQTIKTIPTNYWLTNQDKHLKLTKLLNFNLKELCWRKKFHYDSKHNRYYKRYFGGKIPTITWKPYKKTATRHLVTIKVSKTTGNRLYCEHFAGKLNFRIMGHSIYLIIEPCRVLTQDGMYPLDQKKNVKISTKKNFHYHNNNYLYDMKFWLHILAGTKKEIYLDMMKEQSLLMLRP